MKTLIVPVLVLAFAVVAPSSFAVDCSGVGSVFTLVPVQAACDLTDIDHAGTTACKIVVDGTETATVIGRPSSFLAAPVTLADRKCAKKFDGINWVNDNTNYPVTSATEKYMTAHSIFVSGRGGPAGRFNTDHVWRDSNGVGLPDPGARFACVEDLNLNCGEFVGTGELKFRKMRVKP